MLQHVWNCQHLSKGLYWCFHCQKPERVGKFQCKRCQGLPSRTDRMASVAKRIFSKLGAKPYHAEFLAPEPESPKTLSKIAEDSETSYPSGFASLSRPFDEDQAVDWDHQYPQELPNTSVCREMPGDWTAASHELPDNYISEMQGTECPIELSVGSENWADNFYASSLEEWDVPSLPVKGKSSSPKLARIDTSFTNLNSHVTHEAPGQISPQKYSSHSWETPLSATIISPLSASGAFNTNTFEVSPTDTEASGNSFFTDSGYSTATTLSAWSTTATRFGDPDSLKGITGEKRSRHFEKMSDDWMNNMVFSRPTELALMPVLASVPQMPKEISIGANSVNRFTGSEKPILSSRHWSDARSLVQYFSGILDDHIEHTKTTLKQLHSSPLLTELMALSRTSMVSIGLEVLAGVLEGRKPTSIVQIFSLTHVAYAFAIAVGHDETNVQDQKWFQDSLSWAEELTSERQRQMYHQIARSIWQPLDIFSDDIPVGAFPSSDNENLLLNACKHFLDGTFITFLSSIRANMATVFESFGTPKGVFSLLPSTSFDYSQEMFQSKSKTRVIDELIKTRSIEAFDADVVTIGRRLREGKITSTRQLELELICAGKVKFHFLKSFQVCFLANLHKLASRSASAFAIFLSHVTRLCESLYLEEPGTSKSRTAHHIQDISEIKQFLPEEHYNDGNEDEDCQHDEHHSHMHDDEEDLLDLNFDTRSEDIEACINAFKNDADQTLGHTDVGFTSQTASTSSRPIEHGTSLKAFESTHQQSTSSFQEQSNPQKSISTPGPYLPPSSPTSSSPNKYRCHCGYTPAGEERWKASNLRRHKRTQHPTELRVHRCGYPGCKSVFTRSDNLRSHRRDKGHFVGMEGESFY
jgi:hypothetical protein